MTQTVLDRALDKARRHLIPVLFLGYMFAILDRQNISLAALTMNADLGLTASQFGLAGSAFYLGYLALEIPSNLLMQRFGARIWIARIMLTWGLVTMAHALAQGALSFSILRFLLGASEAGFLPGVLLFLTLWFPAAYRTRVTAEFTLSIPVISAIGAVVSTALLSLRGAGLVGWQWMFLLEGVPPVLLAIYIWMRLPEGPQAARFLSDEEKHAIDEALALTRAPAGHRQGLGAALANPVLWALGLINLGFIICNYALSFWLPQIAKGHGFATSQVGWLVALPQLAGAVAMLGVARFVKRTTAWTLVATLSAAGGFMLAATATLADPTLTLLFFTLAGGALYAAIPAFWTVAMTVAEGRSAAASIALVNTVGSLSGVIGPPLIGFLKDRTEGFAAGFYVTTAFLGVSIALTIALRRTIAAAAIPRG